VESAFVATCPGSEISEVQTLAIYAGGGFEENIEYPLSGTVCGTVVGKQFRCIRSGVRGLYPEDGMFRRLEIEGYAAYPLTDSRGAPLGLIGVMAQQPLDNVELVESLLKIFATRAAAEIERSRVEEARRVSEASYSAIFETVEDAIFIHDWDTGAIVDVNPKACEVYGYSRDEMKTLSMDQIGSGEAPYDGQNAKRWLQEARLGRTVRFEWHRRSRDGSLHWDDVSLKRAVISGEPRIIAVTREITDRKRTEDALRSAALAVSGAEGERAFHDLTRDLSATLDMAIAFIAEFFDGDMTRMRTLSMTVDGQAQENTVYDLEGTPCETVVGRAFRIYPERIRQLFSNGALNHYRPESYAAFPLTDSAGKALGLIVVVDRKPMTDAALIESVLKIFAARAAAEIERSRADTRRAQLEAQLRQAQKMEAIGHLTGGIAHDFNNILTSVMGYLAMASERQTNLGDPKLAKYLEQAHLSSQRARDLIQQMLTFSRGKRGEPRPLSLPPLIKESVKLLRATLPSTIEIRTDFESDLPSVLLDPVQVGQVLLNLCINARDAMKGGGNIDVAVQIASRHDMVCTSCRQPVSGRFVELAVADSGSGIQPEVMERMFEPFFTTKEVGKGSGMGLATVHGIVHEHGGHILVDSTPGAGSRFSIVLAPLAETGEAREPAGRARAGKPAGRPRLAGRVLVVDDEETVGEFMCDLMESWGLEVTVSNSAIEARDLVTCDPARFDLVVTDQTMPKLTGLELARTIAMLRTDLPVILYTGYSEEIDDADLEGSGVRALVPKPVEPNVLLGALRANLPGVARVSQA
jgi:PAS domain S-box-containing protein